MNIGQNKIEVKEDIARVPQNIIFSRISICDEIQLADLMKAQFTQYSKQKHYDWHTDSSLEFSQEPPVRKISMGILLNDPKDFKGGEFQLIDSKKTLPLKQGYAVFFASFVAHRVLPVKKGIRISMVLWFGGPSLK